VRIHRVAAAALVVALILSAGMAASAQSAGGCGLAAPAFCETFDAPQGTGNRSAQMNGLLWGVSRTTGNNNPGQGVYDGWSPTTVQTCGGAVQGQPDSTDLLVCNGQLREASNDNGTVTTLAMYSKQPFDFANRTGKVTFDVTNDTQGTHGMWPEFWLTDVPVPAPFTHFDSWVSVPPNGFGVRMAANAEAGQQGACPNGNNINQRRWTVDSAIVVRNYVTDDTAGYGNRTALASTPLDCVIASTGPNDGMNHVELDIAQNQIDVYATDAGQTTMKHIAVISNANLSLSRGLIWIEDSHYNAEKSPCIGGCQDQHTFTWDNVGFDGPVLARDLTFDAPDALLPGGGGVINLAWNEAAAEAKLITINGVTNIPAATKALLTFNFSSASQPVTFTYVINGHIHLYPWPYPDTAGSSWRTLALPVPLSDLQAGTNLVSVTGDQPLMVANMDIVLAGAGAGGVTQPTPVPTATLVPAATATPPPPPATATAIAATATAVALTPTPVTTSCTDSLIRNGTPTTFTRPLTDCANQ
jgi:hypothetical protein